MDNKDVLFEGIMDAEAKKPDHSQQPPIRREMDSLDDFEHLGHDDNSPLRNNATHEELFSARDAGETAINKGVEKAATTTSTAAVHKITDIDDDELSSFDPLQQHSNSAPPHQPPMDSNLFEMGDTLPKQPSDSDKMDKFLEDMSSFAPPPTSKHQEPPEIPNKDLVAGLLDEEDTFKNATQNFMDNERDSHHGIIQASKNELNLSNEQLERYSDVSEEEPSPKKQLPQSDFKDLDDFEPELPKKDYPAPPPATAPAPEPFIAVCPAKPEPAKKAAVIDAEAIFCKMGLDTWFNPERLNPKVESLIYWRDPKKSGPVFGGVLLVLLSLTYFSLISVVAYLSLLGLTGTISFRIYKNIVQAVQKTGDGHPFKELLEFDVSLPQEKVKEVSEVAVVHINAGVTELRRLFLVEDLVDSIKFGVLLWTLTYLGAWFNGMTLIIIAWVALFSLPKVYETNKTQIDANLEIVRTKLADITSKVKAAIPIGKKVEEKKEQ